MSLSSIPTLGLGRVLTVFVDGPLPAVPEPTPAGADLITVSFANGVDGVVCASVPDWSAAANLAWRAASAGDIPAAVAATLMAACTGDPAAVAATATALDQIEASALARRLAA